MIRSIQAAALVACTHCVAFAQTDTTFTYQGSLEANGSPLTGSASILFSLWTAPVLGAEVGTPVLLLSVPVTDGLFTASLDFGADAFDNAGRWLQISVNGTTLSPRQPITRAPYSIQTRGIFVGDDRRVGIGNTAPSAKLHVTSDGGLAALRLTNGGTGLQTNTGLLIDGVTGVGRAASFSGATAGTIFGVQNTGSGTAATFTGGNVLVTNGDLGVGTTSPIARMQVTSDGARSAMRITNGGGGSQNNTGLIIGDVTAQGRAASFYGITSNNLMSVQNDGSGKAAAFSGGDVSFTGGNVGIGVSNPTSALHVAGDYYGLGHIWLHAFEGDGQSGRAYIQARDNSSDSTISMVFRTQSFGNYVDAVRLYGSRVEVSGENPGGSAPRVYVEHFDQSFLPSPAIRVNRTGIDGSFIDFMTGDVSRGSVTVNGNTVSYNAFTGSHYTHPDGVRSIERGTLVRMTGNNTTLSDEPDAEVVYGVAPTTTANDAACLGAYLAPDSMPVGARIAPHLVMAAGNGDMWVVDSGTGDLEPGDALISSSVAGCAMKDDPARFATGHVVARSAQRVEWELVQPDRDGVRRTKVSVLFGSYERAPDTSAIAGEVEQLRLQVESLKGLIGQLQPQSR